MARLGDAGSGGDGRRRPFGIEYGFGTGGLTPTTGLLAAVKQAVALPCAGHAAPASRWIRL